MKITVRLYRNNKVVKRMVAEETKWRKVYAKLASAQAQKYLVRVEYGKKKVGKGEVLFFNEYFGDSASEAKQAFRAFMEDC